MMKHSKRFLCLLLTLILAASLCVFPAAAADRRPGTSFVAHGARASPSCETLTTWAHPARRR